MKFNLKTVWTRINKPGKLWLTPIMISSLVFFSLGGCGQEIPRVSLAPITGGVEEPTILFERFHMVATQASTVEWEFWARAAQIYEKKSRAKAQDIKIVYWQQGRPVSTLTARRGYVNTDSNDLWAEEKVEMISQAGVRLLTEKLHWDQKKAKIFTDVPVKVIRRDSILTGRGMEADSELKHVDVLAEVKIKLRSIQDLKLNTKPIPEKVP